MRRFLYANGFFGEVYEENPTVVGKDLSPGSIYTFRVFRKKEVPRIVPAELYGVTYSNQPKIISGEILLPRKLQGLEIIIYGLPNKDLREHILNATFNYSRGYASIRKAVNPLYTPNDLPDRVAIKINKVQEL